MSGGVVGGLRKKVLFWCDDEREAALLRYKITVRNPVVKLIDCAGAEDVQWAIDAYGPELYAAVLAPTWDAGVCNAILERIEQGAPECQVLLIDLRNLCPDARAAIRSEVSTAAAMLENLKCVTARKRGPTPARIGALAERRRESAGQQPAAAA